MLEKKRDQWHVPGYTKGCWGKPGEKMCWFCKVRYIVSMIKIFYRTRKELKSNND